MTDSYGRMVHRTTRTASLEVIPEEIAEFHFGHALEKTVKISVLSMNALSSQKDRRTITAQQLAKNWKISLSAAEKTASATTQYGIRSIANPSLSRRFRTNDRQLRYRRIPYDVYTDTMQAQVTSHRRKNKYCQIFCTRFGWVRAYPMQRKSDAHFGLSNMAQQVGVPISLVMDGAREQTHATFRKKAREMGCHVKQTEPYSPWQNAAEGCIRELKRGAAKKAAISHSPL